MIEKEIFKLIEAGKIKEASDRLSNLSKGKSIEKWVIQNLKGAIKNREGLHSQAISAFEAAVRLANGAQKYAPLCNLASSLNNMRRFVDALPYAKQAYELQQTSQSAMLFLTAMLDGAKTKEALTFIEELPTKIKSGREFLLAHAACKRQEGLYDEAVEIIRGVLEEDNSHPTATRMLADTLGEQGKVNPIPIYERALSLAASRNKKDVNAIRWNMSLHLLRQHEFTKGFEYYESGLHVGSLGRNLAEQCLRMNRADTGKIDKNKWTFIVVEQGIGDQILFLSVMNETIAEFGEKLVVVCEDRMKPILKRSFPNLTYASPGLIEYIDRLKGPYNGVIPLGSLIGRYRKDIKDFVGNIRPYIRVNTERYKKYKMMFRELACGRPVVGISWKGGFWENQIRNKAIELEEWAPLLRKNAYFVSLQYGDVERDLQWAKDQSYTIHSFNDLDFKKDLDSWLAIAAACDGIISVSTALVHFAGAANQKVAIVAPERIGPWHLGIRQSKSIFYPNVFHYWRGEDELKVNFLDRVSRIIQ